MVANPPPAHLTGSAFPPADAAATGVPGLHPSIMAALAAVPEDPSDLMDVMCRQMIKSATSFSEQLELVKYWNTERQAEAARVAQAARAARAEKDALKAAALERQLDADERRTRSSYAGRDTVFGTTIPIASVHQEDDREAKVKASIHAHTLSVLAPFVAKLGLSQLRANSATGAHLMAWQEVMLLCGWTTRRQRNAAASAIASLLGEDLPHVKSELSLLTSDAHAEDRMWELIKRSLNTETALRRVNEQLDSSFVQSSAESLREYFVRAQVLEAEALLSWEHSEAQHLAVKQRFVKAFAEGLKDERVRWNLLTFIRSPSNMKLALDDKKAANFLYSLALDLQSECERVDLRSSKRAPARRVAAIGVTEESESEEVGLAAISPFATGIPVSPSPKAFVPCAVCTRLHPDNPGIVTHTFENCYKMRDLERAQLQQQQDRRTPGPRAQDNGAAKSSRPKAQSSGKGGIAAIAKVGSASPSGSGAVAPSPSPLERRRTYWVLARGDAGQEFCRIRVMPDTGSSIDAITMAKALEVGVKLHDANPPLEANTAGGPIRIAHCGALAIRVGERLALPVFYVFDHGQDDCDAILSERTLSQLGWSVKAPEGAEEITARANPDGTLGRQACNPYSTARTPLSTSTESCKPLASNRRRVLRRRRAVNPQVSSSRPPATCGERALSATDLSSVPGQRSTRASGCRTSPARTERFSSCIPPG